MPFSIESKIQHGFNIIILKDEDSQSKVEVIPACGGILHGFSILNKGVHLNILEQYKNFDDFKTNVENKGFKSCKLSPFACRIKNAEYIFQHQKYRLNKFTYKGDALHGLLYDAAFTVTNKITNLNYAQIELLYQYRATDKGYPFNYDCTICYCLKPDNLLIIETTILNKGDHAIPIQDGWHPYFSFGKSIDKLQLQIKTLQKIELDASLIPTGKTSTYNEFQNFRTIADNVFDNCFELDFTAGQPVCILKDEDEKLQIEIYPDKTYPFLQLFTPDNRSSIAIENLSAIPDAFNNEIGLITLASNTSKKFTTTYKITHLI